MRRLCFAACAMGLLAGFAFAKPTKDVFDNSINAGQTVTWSSDTVYILREKVFVEEGGVLNIQAGTVIKGDVGGQDDATALIICRGARIYAIGTQREPVIFTAISDNLGNLTAADKGLWGGLVILGRAVTNEEEDNIEGIPISEPRGLFGGNDDNDTSGVLRYVSIRHSGATIAPNNELNGLSMGAVGRGTVLEYVETYASSDDGFEWWGGTVNGRYLVSSFCDDDAFDVDQGFRGTLQYIFAIQDSIEVNRSAQWAGEWDGDDTYNSQPYGQHTVANATFIGGGPKANPKNGNIHLRFNGSAKVYNSIFTSFPTNRGVVIEDVNDGSVMDSRKQFEMGRTVFKGNIFWAFTGVTILDSLMQWYDPSAGLDVLQTGYRFAAPLRDSMVVWGNTYQNPALTRIAYDLAALDPTLTTGSPAFGNLAPLPADNPFLTPADHKGAFKTYNWLAYWTALWDEGILADPGPDLNSIRGRLAGAGAGPVRLKSVKAGKNLTVTYSLPRAGDVSVSLYSLNGSKVAGIYQRSGAAGAYTASLSTSSLARGSYTLTLQTGKETVSRIVSILD